MTGISWKNSASGDWNVAGNWSTNTVPTSGDGVAISASGPYTVTISSADQANSLTFNASQAALLENAGSLTIGGALVVNSGLVSLNAANTIGGVDVLGGVLAFGNGGALGTGEVSMFGGELLGAANETIANTLSFSGTSTTAGTDGTTLNEQGNVIISPNSTLNFGAPGQDGVVVLAPGGYSIAKPFTFNVVAGTLRAGSSLFDGIISFGAQPTTVAAGATLDLGGFSLNLTNLLGAGAVVDSGRPATLTLSAANFSGSISGALSLVFNGNATLSGLEDYSGGATIFGSATVANSGTYDIVASTFIAGAPGSSFINNGLFEKTGGGVSGVTSNFVNNGDLDVLSGGVEFSGGFTNHGVIHGLVTQSGGVTTISPQTPSDFNHDGRSDILWQNANGQAAIWVMNGLTQIPGGSELVGSNPGPSWTEIGTGDFNGDGDADILWQNANGQAAIWEMNGLLHPIAGGSAAVGPNPGPGWKVVGTGDFNGDHHSDILWQNETTGQAAIWEMNGLNQIAGGSQLVGPAPGPDWKVVGTGDLNDDGHSDILWQNANGQAAIWEMNGTNVIGGSGLVGPNPGPSWKAVGTGDFNGDGHSDILWQNANGQAAIWEMNGLNQIPGGSAAVGPNPGPSWTVIGAEDFNADGHSDILWQNANGQASIWEMNGLNQAAGDSGLVGPNPGSSWKVVGTGDFNGDGMSDILWQNANGQAAVWEMNGLTQIPGGSSLVGPNPGPSWKAVGTGDNGNGPSDILWQNANGQGSIWEMNGLTQIPGGSAAVGPNPGPGWAEIGTGDFNHDGHADILWQNASNGQAAIWEMNGTNVIGGGLVGPNPGPSWKAVGTGDFNGDGHSDILWQNTDGQAAIWEMNGLTQIPGGSALVGPNPGPDWKVVGTGDFNGDGHSDILWQNANGQAAIWEMNGLNQVAGGSGLVGPNPGPDWKAVGTGDFNGDGMSDILWQNANGQASVWEMNGLNQIAGGAGAVGPNPGPSWKAVV